MTFFATPFSLASSGVKAISQKNILCIVLISFEARYDENHFVGYIYTLSITCHQKGQAITKIKNNNINGKNASDIYPRPGRYRTEFSLSSDVVQFCSDDGTYRVFQKKLPTFGK